MMTRRGKLGALAGLLATGACGEGVMGSPALRGRWGGFIDVGPQGLRLILVIEDKQPIKIISVDQGNREILATRGFCRDTQVDVRFSTINARLKLRLEPQSGALVGEFEQGRSSPITLTRLVGDSLPQRPMPAPFVDYATEVKNARQRTKAPALGGAIASVKDGRIQTREAVDGVGAFGDTAPIAQGLKWHVGSITKAMTATLVARLVERDKLAWTMTIKQAFGRMAPDMNGAYSDVSLAQLMSGRSGMPTNISLPDLFGHVATEQTPTQRRQEWVRQALAMKPEGAPARSFIYPNNGYVLAGALCESVMGKPYEALMAEEVFAPFGMTTAGFGPPPSGNPQGHRKALIGASLVAVGFDEGADNPQAMGPAGRAHMSLTDLATFGLIHAQGHQGLRNEYLSQATWQYLHTPPVQGETGGDYAFGWVARPDGTLWHNGSNTYWLAELAFDPKTAKAACACANFADTEPGVKRVLAAGLASSA